MERAAVDQAFRDEVARVRGSLAQGEDEETIERRLMGFGVDRVRAREIIAVASREERPLTRGRGLLDLGGAAFFLGLGVLSVSMFGHGHEMHGRGSVAPFALIVVGSGLLIRGLHRVLFGR